MPHDCFAFIDLVSYATVMADRDATFGTAIFQPLHIGPVRREQVMMPLYFLAGIGEHGRESLPEITVGEIDAAQAARS